MQDYRMKAGFYRHPKHRIGNPTRIGLGDVIVADQCVTIGGSGIPREEEPIASPRLVATDLWALKIPTDCVRGGQILPLLLAAR